MNKQQLASTIWQSANQMRSKIEANEYKDYILGFMTSKGQVGDDNETYDMLLHLKWTTDYDDIYEELKVQSKDYLIHQPPVKKQKINDEQEVS